VQSIRAPLLRLFGKPLFAVAGWLTAVGIGTGCFASSGARSATDELIPFACSFAVAAPIASAMPLILGGKKRWAVETILAIAFAIAASGVVTYLFLWAAPSLVRSQMGYWEFLWLQHIVLFAASMIASLCAPLGAIVGAAIGTITGLVVALTRQTPKLAAGLMAGLLLACASGAVQSFAFGLAADMVLDLAPRGRQVGRIFNQPDGSSLGGGGYNRRRPGDCHHRCRNACTTRK
jgi:hypothetical protein